MVYKKKRWTQPNSSGSAAASALDERAQSVSDPRQPASASQQAGESLAGGTPGGHRCAPPAQLEPQTQSARASQPLAQKQAELSTSSQRRTWAAKVNHRQVHLLSESGPIIFVPSSIPVQQSMLHDILPLCRINIVNPAVSHRRHSEPMGTALTKRMPPTT